MSTIVTKEKLLNFLATRINELERTTDRIDNVYLIGKYVAYKEVYRFVMRNEE